MRIPTYLHLSRLTCALALIMTGSAAMGQGILYPRDTVREQPFFVKSVRVSTAINDSLAETTVEQTFFNDSSVEQEGTYLFPLPEGASVSAFSLRAGDRVIEARMLGKDEARSIYESIVRRRKDPALLEYMGRGLFRASVYPIPARSERILTLKYTEILKSEGGLKKFSYPLSTGRFSTRPIAVSSVTVKVKSSAPLKTVYSPTHDVSIRRPDDVTASASWEGRGEFPDRDFTLYFATNASDVGLSLLTYDTIGRDGYFMLIASPRVSIPKERILAKQIVFVLDRTGSMQPNGKMEQAKGALRHCLDNLNPNDRFDVITFNESPDVLTKTLLPATRENVEKAQKFVANVEASGGTNIDEALRSALTLLKTAEGNQKMVVFLTDGLPTVGETNVENILATVKRINGGSRLASTKLQDAKEAVGVHARIFSFGVGYDVNVPFLDRLSEQSKADADYVLPTENIESIVSAFYSKVSSPILANLTLAFDGVDTYDVYPRELPDLFKGSQLIITGRYRGDPTGGVKLAGYAQNQQVTFRLDKGFGDGAARNGLVPRIWATRKIGYLLDQVRLHSNQEVVDEIVRLSKEYGIITPYTSFLADERQDQAVRTRALLPEGIDRVLAYDVDNTLITRSSDEAIRELKMLARGRNEANSGAGATAQSLNSRGYRDAGQAPAGAQGGFGGGVPGARGPGQPAGAFGAGGGLGGGRGGVGLRYGDAQEAAKKAAPGDNRAGYQKMQDAARVQAVAGRVFYKRNNIWFDNGYQSGQKVIKVRALSDAHFQLLKAVPMLSKYASVGDDVVLEIGRNAVQIGKEGKESLTDADLKEITAK
jgi:Ca-activated chloride channel homolog